MRLSTHILISALTALSLPFNALAQSVRPQQRVNIAGGNTNPSNQADGIGLATQGLQVVVVWAEQLNTSSQIQDIYASVSNDDGQTWSVAQRIDTGDPLNASDSEGPKVVITDDGTIVSIFQETKDSSPLGNTNEDLFYNRSTDGGVSWLPVALPLNTATSGAHIASDIDGPYIVADGNNVYVVWEEDSTVPGGDEELWFTSSGDSGATWSTPVILSTMPGLSDVDSPTVAASGLDVVVAYVDDANGTNDLWIAHSDDGGNTWTNAAVETVPLGTPASPVIDMDGDFVVVAYEDDGPTVLAQQSIHAVVSTDGGASWQPELIISARVEVTVGAEALRCDVEVRGSRAYIAYSEDSESVLINGPDNEDGAKVYVAVSDDMGASWTVDIPTDPDLPRRGNRPSIVASDDLVYIHYDSYNPGANRVSYTMSSDHGLTWAVPIDVPNSGPDTDTEAVTNGRFFAVTDNATALSAYWDRPLGSNELYVSGIDDEALGVPYCTGEVNSTGEGAMMFATGTTSVAANALVLNAQPVPGGQFGIFYYGPEQIELPFGNGFRCVSGPQVFRLEAELADNADLLSHSLDIANPPVVSGQIVAGSTWNFQGWYRDPAGLGAFFNLSNALEVTFQP